MNKAVVFRPFTRRSHTTVLVNAIRAVSRGGAVDDGDLLIRLFNFGGDC